MKKILVPCDFSMPAQEAFKFAVQIATQSQGEIHVLYIMDIAFMNGRPTLSYTFAFNVNFLKDVAQEAEAKYHDMRDQFAPKELPVRFTHKLGTLIPDIKQYILEHSIDTVVAGTHGAGYRPWATNTEEIVRHSPVPVLAIRHAPTKPVRNIVVPIAPEFLNEVFCDHLKGLQAFFEATLHLLWVNTPVMFKTDDVARAELETVARAYGLKHYATHVRTDYHVDHGIHRFAREIDADLIAMATHAWKGLMHVMAGSVAEDVVKKVDVPIWTCPLGTTHQIRQEANVWMHT